MLSTFKALYRMIDIIIFIRYVAQALRYLFGTVIDKNDHFLLGYHWLHRPPRADCQVLVGHSVGVGIVGRCQVFQALTDTESVGTDKSRPTERAHRADRAVGRSVGSRSNRPRARPIEIWQ